MLKVKLIAFADGWKWSVRERGEVEDDTGGFWLEHLQGRDAIPQAGKGLVVCGFGGKFRN